MDVNRALSVNSGSGRRADRRGSLIRRRPSQRYPDSKYEPKIEWVDTPEAHVMVVELPGFKKTDVRMHYYGGENFTISGERLVDEQVYVGGMPKTIQRLGFQFKKVFSIPTNVDIAGITSRFENETLYYTFNKLRAPTEVKSTNILDQERKSIPQVGESSANFIEESSEKKDDKESSNKLDQSLKDENVGTANVANSSATQDEKGSSNKLDQSLKDEKVETPEVVKSSGTQDGNTSNNKLDQSPRDEKVETPRGAKSVATQDDEASSNKLDQSPRDEKIETPKVVKSSGTQDVKASNNKLDQSPRDEKVETPEVVKPSETQDVKASNNKLDQIPRADKVETPGGAKSIATQDDKASNSKLDQSPRDQNVETPGAAKSTMTQDDKALSNKDDVGVRDEMVETIDVANSSVPKYEKASNNKENQSPRDEKVQTLEATKFIAAQPDDEKVGTPKDVKSSTTQEAIQMEIQLEASKRLEDLSKHPSLLSEENPIDYNTHPNQLEPLDSKQKEKKCIFKACTYVSQFISSTHEPLIVAGIVFFSLGLYITYKLAY